MNKHSFITAILLVISTTLFSQSKDEITQLLALTYNKYMPLILDLNTDALTRTNAVNAWMNAFKKAQSFVIENSKNFIGVKDSTIINVMKTVETANYNILNLLGAVKIATTQLHLRELLNKLLDIKKNIDASTSRIHSSKEQSKQILIVLSYHLMNMIQSCGDVIAAKIKAVVPPLPPRSSRT